MCMPGLGYMFRGCDFIGRKLVNGSKVLIFFGWISNIKCLELCMGNLNRWLMPCQGVNLEGNYYLRNVLKNFKINLTCEVWLVEVLGVCFFINNCL